MPPKEMHLDFEECTSIQHLWICENHIKELKERIYNRQRKLLCMLPAHLKIHIKDRRIERRLYEQQVKCIFKATGIVLPIGTGICNTCRKKVLKELPNEIQEQKGLFNISDVFEPEEFEDEEDDDIPLKRARKTGT